jgi:hypothetical protein
MYVVGGTKREMKIAEYGSRDIDAKEGTAEED